MNILFYVAVAMFAGLLMTRLTRLIHLPHVTAYLLAGLLIGPYVFNVVGEESLHSLEVITECALGFIAFSIGDEFKIANIKAIGKPALTITLFESTMAVAFVLCITLLLGFDPIICVMLGALAASTAPAATLMIVRQYQAKGPLTNHLLPVVAADDATGLVAYSICVSIAKGMVNHEAFSVVNSLLMPLMEVVLSLLLGALIGFLLAWSHKLFRSRMNRMSLGIASIMIGVGVANYFALSNLLVCMMIGAMYVNLCDDAERILTYIDYWTYPLFMLFFVISGAHLNLAVVPTVGLLGIVYIVTRFAGKYIGSFIGASVAKCPKVVRENIGWALMPQAGVAIGMATMALTQLPLQYGQQIQTVILSATLVYEVLGPLVTKNALKRAGEI